MSAIDERFMELGRSHGVLQAALAENRARWIVVRPAVPHRLRVVMSAQGATAVAAAGTS